MTSSPAPTAPDLHINTTTAGHSSLTSLSSSHHPHHNPSPSARSPHSSATTGSPRSTTTAGGSSTNQACAACKYQRRKCNPDCPLAPYFPADQQRRFLNAHRLFGVSNILKTLRRLRPELCAEAMGTLIYQAEMRAQDPVGGCYRVILGLERQLDVEVAELNAVLHHLALYRQAAAIPPPAGTADLDVTSSNQPPLLLNADQEVVDALYVSHDADAAPILHADQDHGGDQQQQQQLFDYFYYDATASDDASSKPAAAIDINLDGMQQFDFDAVATDQKVDPVVPEEQLDGMNHCQTDHESSREYADMKATPLVDMFDMRQELQLQVVDVNTDINVNDVDVNADIDVNAVAVNADVDVKPVLQDDGAAQNNIVAGEAAQMAAESSHCTLGLGFSSF